MSDFIEEIKLVIVNGSHKEIEALVQNALDAQTDPDQIVNEAMIPGMDVVGRAVTLKVITGLVTMNRGLDILKPILQQSGAESKGRIVMCTVKGDLHDIGKNLVIMMLEGAGFEVIDMGVDMSVENVIEKVKEVKPDILGLSALLTTTMSEMVKVIESLEANNMRDSLKVMVGGAPVTQAFADQIGADGYASNAAAAAELAKKFVGQG